MDYLYAPWRGDYTQNPENNKDNKPAECPFCMQAHHPEHDEKNLVLKRYKHVFVILNLYPYNAGHLLVIPYTHTDSLQKLSDEERSDIMSVLNKTVSIITQTMSAQGFNVGVNLGGKVAGGSIPEHLHFHVVPRWLGDTNFMVSLADTKPISSDLTTIYAQLKKALDAQEDDFV